LSKKSNKFLNDPFHYSPLRERDHPSRPKTSEIKNEPIVIYLSAMCKLKICEETMLQMKGRDDISLFRQLDETCSMYKNQLSFDELLVIEKNIKSFTLIQIENIITTLNKELNFLRLTFQLLAERKYTKGMSRIEEKKLKSRQKEYFLAMFLEFKSEYRKMKKIT